MPSDSSSSIETGTRTNHEMPRLDVPENLGRRLQFDVVAVDDIPDQGSFDPHVMSAHGSFHFGGLTKDEQGIRSHLTAQFSIDARCTREVNAPGNGYPGFDLVPEPLFSARGARIRADRGNVTIRHGRTAVQFCPISLMRAARPVRSRR